MDRLLIAKWLHDEYENLAKKNNWETQIKTRVDFDNLPDENKNTMLSLADSILETFDIELKCKCICHTKNNVKHFKPCCNNTFKL